MLRLSITIFLFLQVKEKSTDAIGKPTGVLMYSLASSNIKDESQIKFVSNYIANKKIGICDTTDRYDVAI